MKELNELVGLAKGISSKQWLLNADEEVIAVDNDAGPDDSGEVFIGCAANIKLAKYISAASPEIILAIAEAFRALEQRAEAAEAKLAELDKQEPAAFTSKHYWSELNDFGAVKCVLLKNGTDPDFQVELFTRPAPAVSLTELVPKKKITDTDCAYYPLVKARNDGYNLCVDDILRNIEEQSK